ncbi:MAG: Stp1/IreP family PP2C-type Ser/Thr phosphatase [Clostridiales bacterium]|jgi:protein phosphatase|nr:Stp1/IreP family PP2C-type Ser/Thr phosphatase [Clostridiales bacterium]
MIHGSYRTDVGRVRDNNEDAVFVSDSPVGCLPNLYVVADGMGGHSAGEVASGKSVEFFIESLGGEDGGIPQAMLRGVRAANAGVYSLAGQSPGMFGMGTTFSAVCVDGDLRMFAAHVGDSRVYVAAPEGIRQITKDHTYVGEMRRRGEITAVEERTHPRRNLLLKALGTEPDVEPDLEIESLRESDVIVVCSDGLSEMVRDEDIWLSARDAANPPLNRAECLVALANARGGVDNISVIVIDLRQGVTDE